MTNESPSNHITSRRYLCTILILGGLLLSLTCYLSGKWLSDLPKEQTYFSKDVLYWLIYTVEWVQTIGITVFSAGLIGVVLAASGWEAAIKEQIKSIFLERNFIHMLSPDYRKKLRDDLYAFESAKEQVEDQKSFYNYNRKNFLTYYEYPYREDVLLKVNIKEGEYPKENGPKVKCLIGVEELSYTCRASVTNKRIQNEAILFQGKDEWMGSKHLESHCMRPRVAFANKDENTVTICGKESTDLCPNYDAGICHKSKAPINEPLHWSTWQNIDPEIQREKYFIQKRSCDLREYESCDRLKVFVKTEYYFTENQLQRWFMATLTHDMTFQIVYPDTYELSYVSFFGESTPEVKVASDRRGELMITCPTWVLMGCGLSYVLKKNVPKKKQPASNVPASKKSTGNQKSSGSRKRR